MGLGAGLSRDFRGGVSGSLVFGGGASGRLVLVVGSRFFGGGALPGVWRRGFRLQVFEGGAGLPAPGSLGLPHVLGGVAWLQVLPFCRCFPIPNTPTGRKCGGGGGWEGGGSCNTPHPTLCYCRTYTNPGAVGEGGRTPHNSSILSPLPPPPSSSSSGVSAIDNKIEQAMVSAVSWGWGGRGGGWRTQRGPDSYSSPRPPPSW